jgi:ABC-2 type transport system permease protein
MDGFSFTRFLAVLKKEWTQLRRDPLTLRFIIALPLMQLFLFGFAINSNPHNLPTDVLSADHSNYERRIVAALKNSSYYDIREIRSERNGERDLAQGNAIFVLNIPPNFARDVDRGESPALLLDTDATDPVAIGSATAALAGLGNVLDRDLPPKMRMTPTNPPYQFIVHGRYNPEQLTVLNTVPGLICIVLMFSTLFLTTLSITRERERGTMENLLAMPLRPVEVVLAKVVPYIGIGYIQVLLIIAASVLIFHLPVRGSLPLLLVALFFFIASNVALGLTISTLATSQMQATQLAQFMLLPSFMLSGFMFPFKGMPIWAQWLGEIFPVTHMLRISRGMLLKGNAVADVLPQIWPIALFALAITTIGVWFYRETLD